MIGSSPNRSRASDETIAHYARQGAADLGLRRAELQNQITKAA
jgi:hypothetical protein